MGAFDLWPSRVLVQLTQFSGFSSFGKGLSSKAWPSVPPCLDVISLDRVWGEQVKELNILGHSRPVAGRVGPCSVGSQR